jgi:hypothetical protein
MVGGFSRYRYETQSVIGSLGFAFHDFFWAKTIVQRNKYSVNHKGFTNYPSYFASLDLTRALMLDIPKISAGILRMNYIRSYDYGEILKAAWESGYQRTLAGNKTSIEMGLDILFARNRNKVSITYFKNQWIDPSALPSSQNFAALAGVELLILQRLISQTGIALDLTSGVSWNSFNIDVDRLNSPEKRTALLLNPALRWNKMFGNVLVNISDETLKIPVREVVIGFNLFSSASGPVQSAKISLIGKNILIQQNSPSAFSTKAYPFYAVSFSVGFR